MIRTSTLLVSATLLAGAVSAQSMEERYEKKLKKEFISNAAWVQSLDDAMAKAAKENKLIFGYFSRSYSP